MFDHSFCCRCTAILSCYLLGCDYLQALLMDPLILTSALMGPHHLKA